MSGTDEQMSLGLGEAEDARPRAGRRPAGASPPPLPDAADRDAIASALDENLLVEAGAGSGKTTELVNRMVALVATGSARVQEIAAVTFTRKAAGELRERFQAGLERARARALPGSDEAARFERALQDLDRAFMGTIHAFCARLLRERPLDAALDPAFRETTAREADRLARRFWIQHLERLSASEDPSLEALRVAGLRPRELQDLYMQLREYLDVEFPAPEVEPPPREDVEEAKARLLSLMEAADEVWPDAEPAAGPDTAMQRLRTAWFLRRALGWGSDRVFFESLASLCETAARDVTLSRWEPDRKKQQAVKELRERIDRFGADGTPERRTLERWYAYRYAPALRFARRAAEALAEHRRRTGQLDFQDLLGLTARLLRERPAARRDLGRRYKHLLVDEFQDTDPLQAEVLFLLASDPGEEAGPADWRRARPRPGALFVVGDPKQSIYRFRRADISLYMQVRERFAGFGRVLRLTANFRSGEPIGTVVNDVLGGDAGFPSRPHEAQAGFAPLLSQRRGLVAGGRTPPPREGVFLYDIGSEGKRQGEVYDWGAEALARWIAGRIAPDASAEERRRPGDFLVLTRLKGPLERYARALERWGVPVQVSGAGIGVEDELAELRVVLEALADPDDPVRTLAALTGLFFGLDHQQLLDHRRAGLGFDLRAAREGTGEPVEEALATLRRWWREAREQPADLVVAGIAAELGLLPYAAAGELGAVRAGALAYALDAVRAGGLEGDTSLTGALEVLQTALQEEEAEAPLEPGRTDVVRLMNLHKAKGLEGAVVVLAAPDGERDHAPDRHVRRDPEGGAVGWLQVMDGRTLLARPPDWRAHAAEERRFQEAEEVRLLYVAATRAGDELVVSRHPEKPARSPWRMFYPWLERHGTRLSMEPGEPPARPRLERAAAEISDRQAAAGAARTAAAAPTFRFETVTARTKGTGADSEAMPDTDAPGPGRAPSSGAPAGFEWGSAVHGVLEMAARGAEPRRLRAVGRALLLDLDRPTREGEPAELDALMGAVRTVLGSPLWRRATAARRRLAEVPFALAWDDAEGSPTTYLEGVVDLAFLEPDGWVLVDYKTDLGTDPDFARRRRSYRDQLATYGGAWERLTGDPVKERLILWTRSGDVEAV